VSARVPGLLQLVIIRPPCRFEAQGPGTQPTRCGTRSPCALAPDGFRGGRPGLRPKLSAASGCTSVPPSPVWGWAPGCLCASHQSGCSMVKPSLTLRRLKPWGLSTTYEPSFGGCGGSMRASRSSSVNESHEGGTWPRGHATAGRPRTSMRMMSTGVTSSLGGSCEHHGLLAERSALSQAVE
jgi:hypothetical protein